MRRDRKSSMQKFREFYQALPKFAPHEWPWRPPFTHNLFPKPQQKDPK